MHIPYPTILFISCVQCKLTDALRPSFHTHTWNTSPPSPGEQAVYRLFLRGDFVLSQTEKDPLPVSNCLSHSTLSIAPSIYSSFLFPRSFFVSLYGGLCPLSEAQNTDSFHKLNMIRKNTRAHKHTRTLLKRRTTFWQWRFAIFEPTHAQTDGEWGLSKADGCTYTLLIRGTQQMSVGKLVSHVKWSCPDVMSELWRLKMPQRQSVHSQKMSRERPRQRLWVKCVMSGLLEVNLTIIRPLTWKNTCPHLDHSSQSNALKYVCVCVCIYSVYSMYVTPVSVGRLQDRLGQLEAEDLWHRPSDTNDRPVCTVRLGSFIGTSHVRDR